MAASLRDATAFEDKDLVGVTDSRKAVGDDEAGAIFHEVGVPPNFDPIVMRGFVRVSGCFRCLAERRP